MRTFIVIIVLFVVLPLTFLLALSATPVVNLPYAVTALGQATPITVHVSDPHGIRRVTAFVEQNGVRYKAWDATQPARRFFWQRGVADGTWNFTVGARTTPELKDGKARLIIEATSNDFRAKTARDRKSTRLNSSHRCISYAVFCLKKKKR